MTKSCSLALSFFENTLNLLTLCNILFFAGISEMYKTPVVKKRKSEITKSNTRKTPVDLQNPSVAEPSVLDTPEEIGNVNFLSFN